MTREKVRIMLRDYVKASFGGVETPVIDMVVAEQMQVIDEFVGAEASRRLLKIAEMYLDMNVPQLARSVVNECEQWVKDEVERQKKA